MTKIAKPAPLGTFDWLTRELVQLLDAKCDQVTPEATLVDDLGADSLDYVEMTMRIEEHFGIELADDRCEHIKTVKELHDYIEELIAAEGVAPSDEPTVPAAPAEPVMSVERHTTSTTFIRYAGALFPLAAAVDLIDDDYGNTIMDVPWRGLRQLLIDRSAAKLSGQPDRQPHQMTTSSPIREVFEELSGKLRAANAEVFARLDRGEL